MRILLVTLLVSPTALAADLDPSVVPLPLANPLEFMSELPPDAADALAEATGADVIPDSSEPLQVDHVPWWRRVFRPRDPHSGAT